MRDALPTKAVKKLKSGIARKGPQTLRLPTPVFLAERNPKTPERLSAWEEEPGEGLPPLVYVTPRGYGDVLAGGKAIANAYLDGRPQVECEVVGVLERRKAVIRAVRLEVERRRWSSMRIAQLVAELLPPEEVDATFEDYEKIMKEVGLGWDTFEQLVRANCIDEEIVDLVAKGRITDDVAVFLAAYEEHEDQVRLAHLAVEKGWGTRELHALHRALPNDADLAADPEWVDRYWKNWIPGLAPAGTTTGGTRT